MLRLTLISLLFALGLAGCRSKQNTLLDRQNDYYFKKGDYLKYYGQTDSAFYFFNKFVATATDSLQKGKAYNHMAAIQYDAGDYFGAQESVLASIAALDPTNRDHDSCLLSNYNTLGNTLNALQHYDDAIRIYDEAAPFKHLRDYHLNLANGKAVALQKKGEYGAAFHLLDSALQMKPTDTEILARIISNHARARWLLDSAFIPVNDFHRALNMRLDIPDSPGVTTSYAHLADYFVGHNRDSSLHYAQRMFDLATARNDAEDKIDALRKLIKANAPVVPTEYYNLLQHLSDSLQLARNAAKNQFALIRYDADRAKLDNLLLQQAMSKQRLVTYGIIAFAIAGITAIILAYNKKRRRIRQQAEIAIRENQLQTSQKVHDVVANGLYGIINHLEYKPEIDKEELLDRIESLYEKSRDISYERGDNFTDANHQQSLAELLSSFGSPSRKIVLAGDVDGCLEKLSPRARTELRQVLQELMINMKKHSRAENVALRFKNENNEIHVGYRDDGIGLPKEKILGNGLKSTVNRILAIGGSINFDRTGNKGAKIDVTLPVENQQYD